MNAASVSIAAVRKSFGGRTVLDGVSFSVAPGERVALVDQALERGRIEIRCSCEVDEDQWSRLGYRKRVGKAFALREVELAY